MTELATAGTTESFSLTAAQTGMWLAEQAEQGSRVRCIAEYFDIPGHVDVEAFRSAWCRTYAETDALRIGVIEGDQALSQVIRLAPMPHVSFVDYSDAPDAHAAAVAWMTADITKPIDVTGDIHTVVLFRIAENRHLWYQKCHHVALDGYSGAIFAQRVCAHYDALVAGRSVEPTEFGRMSELVEDDLAYTTSPQHDLDRKYWLDLLVGCPAPARLSSVERDTVPGISRVSTVLSAEEYADLRHALGRSLAPTIIAAYGVYHAMLSGQDDVLLGLPVTARKSHVARRTPGMTSNVVPVRVRLGDGPTFRSLVMQVGRQVRASLTHQRYRIEELRRDLHLGLDEQIFPGPIVNIMAFPVSYTLGGLQMVAHNLSNGPTNDLALAVYDRRDGRGIQLDLDGNTQFYSERDLSAHLEGFLELLRTVTADPEMSALVPSLRPTVVPSAAAPATRDGRRGQSGRPADDRELLVAALFAKVLGLPEVGVDDSFFEIGGDSITAIAFAAQAREAGLPIVLRQLFIGQTPAAIAATLADVTAQAAPSSVRPTPAARRLADLGGPIDSLHQSVLVQVPAGLDMSDLMPLLRTVIDRHDMLRASLADDLSMQIAAPGTIDVASIVRRSDAADVANDAWSELVAAEAREAARRLAPRSGVMLQAVWFDRGSPPARLLLVAHGLVVDATSWRVLLQDLRAGLWDGPTPSTASYAAWSQWIEAEASDVVRLAELKHWLQTMSEPEPPIGGRALDPAVDIAATVDRLIVSIDSDTAAILRHLATDALHARIDEVLVGALAPAIGEWRRRLWPQWKTETILIDMLRDGRPEPTSAADLTRTVGHFTATVPVRVATGVLEWTDVVAGTDELAGFVLATKDSLRSVPGIGDGYDLLRYLNRSTEESMAACTRPQISFSCRAHTPTSWRAHTPTSWRAHTPTGADGWAHTPTGADGWAHTPTGADGWAVLPESYALPAEPDPAMPFGHTLLIDVDVIDGADDTELRLLIRWPRRLLTRAEVGLLAELWEAAMQGIAKAVGAARTARHSPTDMTMGSLSQQEIDEFEAELEGWV